MKNQKEKAIQLIDQAIEASTSDAQRQRLEEVRIVTTSTFDVAEAISLGSFDLVYELVKRMERRLQILRATRLCDYGGLHHSETWIDEAGSIADEEYIVPARIEIVEFENDGENITMKGFVNSPEFAELMKQGDDAYPMSTDFYIPPYVLKALEDEQRKQQKEKGSDS